MADDSRIRWSLANSHGILIDEAADTWWSGRVFDVLELDVLGTLLVATETGGVWLVSPGKDGTPLSDTWNSPDVNCLAMGPFGPHHVFAGCDGGVIYETDTSQAVPLLAWTEVSLPVGAGDVFDLAVLKVRRLIVAACAGGLYWSDIPDAAVSSVPRKPFNWTRADEESAGQNGYYSIALGSEGTRPDVSTEQSFDNINIIAGSFGGGVFVGRWKGGKLVMNRAKLIDAVGGDITTQFSQSGGATSVAGCYQYPRTVYAACAKADGTLQMVVRSTDGGQTFKAITNFLKGVPGVTDITAHAGEQGEGGDPNNCIAVHPRGPGIVAIGWQRGTFITAQAGEPRDDHYWLVIDGSIHHPDVHTLLFHDDPSLPETRNARLYIGSDGGLADISVDDVFEELPVRGRSDFNRNLPTIQCYSTWVTRQFYGTMSYTPNGSGRIASGVHDNGNICCNLADSPALWRQLDSGDGGWNGILKDGGLVRNIMGRAAGYAQPYASGFVDKGIVPLTLPAPGDPAGIVSPIGDVVRNPSYHNAAGQIMYAAGGSSAGNGNIYGLFNDGPEQTYHWEKLGVIPGNLQVSAVSSYQGATIFVGAGAQRMFGFDSKNGTSIDLPIILPKTASGTPETGGGIPRIAALSTRVAFAILNRTDSGNNYILRLDGLKWVVPLSAGLPLNAEFYALDGLANGDRVVVFTATDDKVYLSEDLGETWVQASKGLPRRPHCADLRVGRLHNEPRLFLSTFGRSVWSTNLERLQVG
jgi:hypothetical protein